MNKIVNNGYIIAITSASTGDVISESEYNAILGVINNAPKAPEGYTYKLRADNLEWELVELPVPEPVEENAEISDYENALSDLGVRLSD